MEVSWNRDTPKWLILVGFSLACQPFWGTLMESPICIFADGSPTLTASSRLRLAHLTSNGAGGMPRPMEHISDTFLGSIYGGFLEWSTILDGLSHGKSHHGWWLGIALRLRKPSYEDMILLSGTGNGQLQENAEQIMEVWRGKIIKRNGSFSS